MERVFRPIEFWKPITKDVHKNIMEDCYWISSEGRVYSIISNRIMKQSVDKYGYCYIGLYDKNHHQINLFIHRIVLLSFDYNPDHIYLQANHKNGIKTENDIYNLEWTTPKENIIHAHRTGLASPKYGEENPMSVITNDQADLIAKLLSEEHLSIKEIADMIGRSQFIVSSIYKGQNWSFYHNKYNLSEKNVPRYNEVFSINQLHYICKYFEDNMISILTKDIKINILQSLNLEPTAIRLRTISRLFNRERFLNISSKYNF